MLTLLAGHRDPIVSSHACGALANLAENMRTHERILGTGAANTLSLLCDPNTLRGKHFGDATRQLYEYNAGEESMGEMKEDWDPHGMELDEKYHLNLVIIRRYGLGNSIVGPCQCS